MGDLSNAKNTHVISLLAPNHSHKIINTMNTTPSLFWCSVKPILLTSFNSVPYNNLTICSKPLAHCSWRMRLLHTVSLAGKSPAQRCLLMPTDAARLPAKQSCRRQMEKLMLEQQMTVWAKTHFRWKNQKINHEIKPIRMCREHLPSQFSERFIVQIENSSFQEGNEWGKKKKGGGDYLTQEKMQLQGSFCYQITTSEIAMAPV